MVPNLLQKLQKEPDPKLASEAPELPVKHPEAPELPVKHPWKENLIVATPIVQILGGSNITININIK